MALLVYELGPRSHEVMGYNPVLTERRPLRDTPAAAAVSLSRLEWAGLPVIERRFPELARTGSARDTVYSTA